MRILTPGDRTGEYPSAGCHANGRQQQTPEQSHRQRQ